MRKISIGFVIGVMAVVLLYAGVAMACPSPPPVCTSQVNPLPACDDTVTRGTLTVSVPGANYLSSETYTFYPQSGNSEQKTWSAVYELTTIPTKCLWADGSCKNNCDQMVVFALSDLNVALPQTPADGISPQWTDKRITKVQMLETDTWSRGDYANTAKRYGSGAVCLWSADVGYPRRYMVTVEAWDNAHGQLQSGTVNIKIDCGTLEPGDVAPAAEDLFDVERSGGCIHDSTNNKRCFEVVAEAPQCVVPPPDPGGGGGGGGTDPNGGGGGGGGGGTDPNGGGGNDDPNGGDYVDNCDPAPGVTCPSQGSDTGSTSTAPTNTNTPATSASDKLSKGGCASFPGAGPWSVLAMLGLSLAMQRRR